MGSRIGHRRRADPGLDAGDQAGGRGHPRRRPVELHGDKGDDDPRGRRHLRRRGIAARIARIGRDSSARLDRHRSTTTRFHVRPFSPVVVIADDRA
jgi:hypothetical protein